MNASEIIDGMNSGFFNEPFLVGGMMTYSVGGKNLHSVLGHSSKAEGVVKESIGRGRVRELNVIKSPERLAGSMGVQGPPKNLDELLKTGFDVVGVPVEKQAGRLGARLGNKG